VRYAYAFTAALLLGGSSVALVNGTPVTAQTAQNEDHVMRALAPGGAPMSFADLAQQLQPAVVNISTKQTVKVESNPMAGLFGQFFGQRGAQQGQPRTQEAQSLGSGFIISADGYIVTNNHVVAPGNENATVDSITVIMPDRTEYDATLVGRDSDSDIAVLKINAKGALPFVKLGDSTKARVGDWVVAIGNPLGLGGTVTSGIVSALYRNVGQGGVDTGGAYDRFIQTDAAINQGNSGGPLFNLNGEVIGINRAILSPTGGSVGLGFATPSEVAAPIINALKSGEKIERGYLGIQFQPLSEDLAASIAGVPDKNSGAFVQSVVPGAAAAKAGIQPGDVITKINGQDINLDNTLAYVVANIPVGQTVPVEVVRNGQRKRLNVNISQRPSDEELASLAGDDGGDFSEQDDSMAEQAAQADLGIATVELTPTIRRQLRLNADVQGVVVNAVDPNSDAARKGISRGAVILMVGGAAVPNVQAFERAIDVAQRSGKEAVLLRVQPLGGRPPLFVPVRIQDE
jgi:serine protease Do